MTTGSRMKARRKELNIPVDQIAAALDVSIATVYRYESGDIEKVPGTVLEPLAKVLQTTPAYLMGWEDNPEKNLSREIKLSAPGIAEDVVTFPIITSVAAHYDACPYNQSLESENVDIPARYLRGRPREEYCVMRVNGDSMYPDFRDGDLVLVLRQPTLDRPRDIGVIAYGDEEMTLKRIDYVPGEDWLEMIPINPNFPPKRIEGAELERCRVIGIPRLLLREM